MKSGEFGVRLRELRKQAGFSQRELADKVGVNFSYLSKIESGAMPPPSQKVILRLAEALNADQDELITLAGKIPSDIAQILQNRETWQLLRSQRPQQRVKASSKIRGVIPRNFKAFARVALAIILVASIGASLWFASPTPVRALEMSFPSLPATGTLGSTYTFTVKIDIASTELVPIQSIDLEIYNLASPTAYKATLTNLPLTATTKSYTSAQTGGGAVSVTATTSNWGWGYGYGYAVWQGTPQYFGYGYGYGVPTTIATITYAITWTSPSGWPTGGYKAKATVTANTTTFTKTSSQFTLSAVESVAVESVVTATSVATNVFGSTTAMTVNSNGVVQNTVTFTSADGKESLTVPAGTIAKDANGNPLSSLTAAVNPNPPAPPSGKNILLALDFGPSGATFSPPVTLTISYDPAVLAAQGISEDSLVIVFYNAQTGQWETIPGTIDKINHTVVGAVSHFTTFALTGSVTPPVEVPPVTPVTPPVTPPVEVPPVTPVTPPVTPPVEVPPVTPPVTPPPTNWGLIIGAIIAGVIIIGVAVWLVVRRRRA